MKDMEPFMLTLDGCLECDGKPIKIRCEHVSLRTTPSALSLLWYAAVTSCFNMLAPLPKYTDALGSVSLTHTKGAQQIKTYQRHKGIWRGSESSKVITF